MCSFRSTLWGYCGQSCPSIFFGESCMLRRQQAILSPSTLCQISALQYINRLYHMPDNELAKKCMMTSSNGNIFCVTGPLCGEFTVSGEFPAQRPVSGALVFSLICARMNGWVNNREAGDLRRYRAHYDVIVMVVLDLVQLNNQCFTTWATAVLMLASDLDLDINDIEDQTFTWYRKKN